jgi:hypothetical protein
MDIMAVDMGTAVVAAIAACGSTNGATSASAGFVTETRIESTLRW